MSQHYGIDISSYQWPINFGAVVNELRSWGGGATPFVIVKATEANNYVNPYFLAQIQGFRAAGALVGAYLFDHGSTSPGQEHALFISVAGNVPAALDIENPQGLSSSAYAAHIQQVLNLEPQDMVYLNPYEAGSMPGAPWGKALWLADYNNNPGVVTYPCTVHQYNAYGSIAGIGGSVDLDVWLGNEASFEAFFKLAPAPNTAPPPPLKGANGQPLNAPIDAGSGDSKGYAMVARDGGIFTFGAPFKGSLGNIKLNAPIVDVALSPSGNGYWLVGVDGGIFQFGDAAFHGSLGNVKLNAPIVGMAPTSTGQGYWLVASDGGIFQFGDAAFKGSLGSTKLNKPIVGIAGHGVDGYVLVGSDGGVFNFGSAAFAGSLPGAKVNVSNIVSIDTNPATSGYVMAGSDGGVFTFNSPYLGSAGNMHLHAPVVSVKVTPTGHGYWLFCADGGVLTFGDASFHGVA